jgi:hypothetical protein
MIVIVICSCVLLVLISILIFYFFYTREQNLQETLKLGQGENFSEKMIRQTAIFTDEVASLRAKLKKANHIK